MEFAHARPCPFAARLRTHALASLAAMLLFGASTISCRPTPLEPITGAPMQVGDIQNFDGPTADRQKIVLYAGTEADKFRITLNWARRTSPLGEKVEIKTLSGAHISTVETNAEAGLAEVDIPGNAAILEYSRPSDAYALVDLSQLSFTTAAEARMPEPTTSTSGTRFSSLPLDANTSVDLFFHRTQPRTYFLTIPNVGDGDYRVVAEGGCRVFISGRTDEFVIPGVSSDAPLIDGAAGDAAGDVAAYESRHGAGTPLLVTVTSVGMPAGNPAQDWHVRFSISKVRRPDVLWWRFNGSLDDFGAADKEQLRDSIQVVMRQMNQQLYRATLGMLQVTRCNVIVGRENRLFDWTELRVASSVHIGDLRGHTTNTIPRHTELDGKWWRRDDLYPPGVSLAHEYMHLRFDMPDEYRNREFPVCPASMMGGLRRIVLCWPGSHVARRGHPRTNASMWEQLASHMDPASPVPDRTPQMMIQRSPWYRALPFPVDIRIDGEIDEPAQKVGVVTVKGIVERVVEAVKKAWYKLWH